MALASLASSWSAWVPSSPSRSACSTSGQQRGSGSERFLIGIRRLTIAGWRIGVKAKELFGTRSGPPARSARKNGKAVRQTEDRSILTLPYVPGRAFQHSGGREDAPFKVSLAGGRIIRSARDDRRVVPTGNRRTGATAESQAGSAARAAEGGA